MAALKPNVLSIFENETAVIMLIAGPGRHRRHRVFEKPLPLHGPGRAGGHVLPREGTFAGINCLTFVKDGPDRELAIAFINRMLDPGMQQGLAEASLASPTGQGPSFKPDIAKYIAYPEIEDGRDGYFQPRLDLHQPAPAQARSRSTTRSSNCEDDRGAVALRLRELTRVFRDTRAVDRLSLAIEPGSMVASARPARAAARPPPCG